MADTFTSRWGNSALDDKNWVHMPGFILRNMKYFVHCAPKAIKGAGGVVEDWVKNPEENGKIVGIDDREFRFIMSVMSFHYDTTEGKACPSIATIAEIMGKTKRTVYNIKQSLIDKGALTVIPRNVAGNRMTDVYDFSMLALQCETWQRIRDEIGESTFRGEGDDFFTLVGESIFSGTGESTFIQRIRTIKNKNKEKVLHTFSSQNGVNDILSSDVINDLLKAGTKEKDSDSNQVGEQSDVVNTASIATQRALSLLQNRDSVAPARSSESAGSNQQERTKTEKEKQRDEWTLAFLEATGKPVEHLKTSDLFRTYKPEMKHAKTIRNRLETMFPDVELYPEILVEASDWMLDFKGFTAVGYKAIRDWTPNYIEKKLEKEKSSAKEHLVSQYGAENVSVTYDDDGNEIIEVKDFAFDDSFDLGD